MGNLLGSLKVSATALAALQDSISTTQNNVTNAATPGYTRQRLGLASLEFDPATGMAGGVRSTGLIQSRSELMEVSVRTTVADLGATRQQWTSYSAIEDTFDVRDSNSIAANMDRMFSAASVWAITPSSVAAKENLVGAAQDLVNAFHGASDVLENAAQDAQSGIETAVEEINTAAEQIRAFNIARRNGAKTDAGIDAELHVALEHLSELVNIRTLWQEDGTVTVLAGGETPLVIGDHRYNLTVGYYNSEADPAYPEALGKAHIINETGVEISDGVHGGRLGGLLRFRNEIVPHYLGSAGKQGELNRLAKQVADRVNSILASGYPPPHAPYHLFVYGASAVSVAHTIEVNPTLAPGLLSATDPLTIPPTVNGKALQIAALAHPEKAEDMIDGLSFTGYFGKVAADTGREIAALKQRSDSLTQRVAQAKNLRAETSGISLNEEAVQLVEFQRAFEATARMISVLDELSKIAVNIGRA